MSDLRKAAADALEALERFHQDGYNREDCSAAIDALRAALAQEALDRLAQENARLGLDYAEPLAPEVPR